MDSQQQEVLLLTSKINWWQFIAVLILLAGAVMTIWSTQQQDSSLRTDLLIRTRLAELGTSAGQVTALTGSPGDLTSPDYQALKTQLERIRNDTPQVRFAYLMGQRADGTIFFYADSEPPSSADYSPPGQNYPEASAAVRKEFATGQELTEGPESDRWGTWVTAIVPVRDPDTGNLVAVFGMDVNAADWNLLIFRAALPMIIATLLILLLVLVSARFQELSEEKMRRIAESEEHIREKEAFDQVLLDNLPYGIVIVDAKTHIIDLVNPAAAALFGTSPDQITGKKCHLFLCPAAEGACPVTDLHQEIDNAERIMLSVNGSKIPILKSVTKIQIDGREKLIENFLDITRLKDTEAALQRKTKTLTILNDIISTANKADDLPELLNSILNESLRILDFDAGGIYLVDPGTRTARLVHSKNLPEEFLAEIRAIDIDRKPYDTLFTQNTPIITEHYEQINPARSKKYGFHSMASIPLLSKEMAIGALNVISTRRYEISEEEKQTLFSVGRELGSTIKRMAAEEEVKKSSNNLEILLKEIHHRVKNNLQIITSILNLQIRKIEDPTTIEALRDSQSRVRSMALVHEHLYRGRDFSHIDLGNYIRALGTGLFQSYKAANQSIRFDLNIRNIYVDINTSIPLGLISNELITNSLKYAFMGKKDGKISISASENLQALTFVVADNGIGMPDTITLENQASLGLRLVSLLTSQLKGTVTIDRSEGTKFVFTIPKPAEEKPREDTRK
jgi:PAS domain S-box-containing protein